MSRCDASSQRCWSSRAVAAIGAGVAAPSSTTLTPAQVVTRFKALTGAKLSVDARSSYAGHYTALALPQSIGNIGRWGRFSILVVTSGDEADVLHLLTNPHTGELGTPGPATIYWEHGTTIGGAGYWLAKKRYGAGIVLWWYGSEQKAGPTFRRLHKALTAIAAAG